MQYMQQVDVGAAALCATVAVIVHLCIIAASLTGGGRALQDAADAEAEKIKDLTARISKLSTVSNFVEKSMLERQRLRAEKAHAAATAVVKAAAAAASTGAAVALARYARLIAYACLAFTLHSTPIAVLPLRLFGPLASPLAFPLWPSGTVGVIAWLYLCDTIVGSAVSSLSITLGVTPTPPPAQGMLRNLMGKAGLSLPGLVEI
jgi:hypothetical protein